MYIFISNLALADLITSTSIVPNMLSVIWSEGHAMTMNGCISQYFFVFVSVSGQCWLLMMMSFDRCLAIFLPLRYSSIMTNTFSSCLIFLSWFTAITLVKSEVILICQLQFCAFNVIDHFFCDFAPLLALSSTDISVIVSFDLACGVLLILLPFVFILITYLCIFFVILNISSVRGKKKAFSTCSSHLILVCTYYGTLTAVYMAPSDESFQHENKFRSLLFVMLTPITNPITYSLRNQDIKTAWMKMFAKRVRVE
ncbi:olfactory receptor 1500-like [Gastrophryne carolinensis]